MKFSMLSITLFVVVLFLSNDHAFASNITPYLLDTGVSSGYDVILSDNAILYNKGTGRNAYAKKFNPSDLSEQSYILQGQSGFNHYDFDMQPGKGGYMVFSGSNERLFYRPIDSNYNVGGVQYPAHESFHNWAPRVSGDNFIWLWAPGPYTNWDVKIQNITSGNRTTIAGGTGNQGYGNYVATILQAIMWFIRM